MFGEMPAISINGRNLDDFSGDVGSRWEFIADRVMGGISYGEVRFSDDLGGHVMALSGNVPRKGQFLLA